MIMKKKLNYFYNSWIQTTGKGWTGKQVFVGYIFSIIFALAVVFYSFFANLHWTWIQIFAIALIAWDLGGGVLGYNHKSIKIRQSKEKSKLHFFHHNLQHIHPLILIFFNNDMILLGLTVYWFLTFLFYVELLEVNPDTATRRLLKKGEQLTIVFEVIVAVIIVVLSFLIDNVSAEFRTFGIITYGSLPILTIFLIYIPISFQRTISISMVMTMIIISMYIKIPNGFIWFYPVYYLKLLTGFTAKEEI